MSKNERKTEKLTRDFLTEAGIYGKADFIVEEQKSDNPKIQKLLQKASKSGNGVGKPEFIIRKRDDDEFLMIIECKPDIKHHESKNKDQYRDYATDGVFLYASHLSEGFNVIAIAVSGEEKNEYRISSFFQPRGISVASPLLDENNKMISEIISWDRYIKRATFNPELAKARHKNLLKFSRELHEYLRDYAKITEAQKPLLVSGVLLALMDKGFEKAYIAYEGEDLAQKTFQAIRDYVSKARLGENQETKKKAVINAFSFIEHHPELQKKDIKRNESPLKHIIQELHLHVKPFTKDHYDFDIIGDFYGEFVRYTGGDKQGLGIVLTPKHITELFAELAKVNKNSTVLDICAGTGGFLISAMNRMIKGKDVSADEKINILEHRLIGVEQEPSMFALAVSNMILRGDGKTNLYQGDSLKDQNIIEKVREKADTGFINPPYSQKGEDVSEWHFIIRMLDLLKTKGTGIAIVPMALAIDTKNPLREKLLKNHRLEAVMSMPDDLFYPVGVVTCIMVFTAHTPHDSDEHHKSWFGYWKNDGFRKVKHGGRVATEKWVGIKDQWIKDFSNKKDIPESCVGKKVGLSDYWCAEVYLETNYSDISVDTFIPSVLNYGAFLLINKKYDFIRKILFTKNFASPPLNIRKWEAFSYPEVFELTKGHYNNRPELDINGIPFISATESNNGITDFVTKDGTKIFSGKSITVSNDGSIGNAFYQENDFTCSHSVNIIRINNKYAKELNQYIALFLIPLIQKEKFRFNYGFKWRIERMKKSKIKLPIDGAGNPDWQFMENYIKSLPYSASI